MSRLLVETDIETGLRWGELTELRAQDLDPLTRILTVSRTVVQVDQSHHPSGHRFLVKEYPKDKEYRRLKLSKQLIAKLGAHITGADLGADDLLFTMRPPESPGRLRALPDPSTLGFTKPNAADRQYRHGTLTATTPGSAGAVTAKAPQPFTAPAAVPRARTRRVNRGRSILTAISPRLVRPRSGRPALSRAGILCVRPHDIRHAHASWLLAGGADLQMVKDRLGHGSISTTEKYLHTLPEADDDALDAFTRIRNRAQAQSA